MVSARCVRQGQVHGRLREVRLLSHLELDEDDDVGDDGGRDGQHRGPPQTEEAGVAEVVQVTARRLQEQRHLLVGDQVGGRQIQQRVTGLGHLVQNLLASFARHSDRHNSAPQTEKDVRRLFEAATPLDGADDEQKTGHLCDDAVQHTDEQLRDHSARHVRKARAQLGMTFSQVLELVQVDTSLIHHGLDFVANNLETADNYRSCKAELRAYLEHNAVDCCIND